MSDIRPIVTRTKRWPDNALKSVVAAHIPGARLIQASALSGGVSADVYRLDIEAADGAPRSIVLRAHGPHHNGHAAALEFEILNAVSDLGLCAPRPLALDESLVHVPYPFLLLHHIEGKTEFPTRPDDMRIVRMAQTLAHIHAVPITNLPKLPMRVDPTPELFDYLPQGTEFEELRARLSDIDYARSPDSAALLHGDFWPGNLLWKDQDLVGILDWEDAALGDPLSDVACTALELRYVAGFDGAESFLRAYARLRPIDMRRFALWQLFVAAAAQHFMGSWGLEVDREAHMRATALSVIGEASAFTI
jgi:aminoglycoside phosphotransferase (APT) family kinase protein